MLAAVLCLLLLGIVVIVAVATSGSSKDSGGDDTTDDAAEDYYQPGGSQGGSDVLPAETTIVPTTTTTTSTSTTTTTTTTTTEKPQLRSKPSLCTVTLPVPTRARFPSLALCDLIFFTHVVFDDATTKIRASTKQFEPTSSSFEVFKDFANSAKQIPRSSQFGISVDAGFLGAFKSKLESTLGANEFNHLIDNNIKHFGVLSVFGGSETTTRDLLQKFRSMCDQHDPNPGVNHKSLIVIGITARRGANQFKRWMEHVKNFPYDIILIHTHVSYWDTTSFTGTAGASIWDSSSFQHCSMKAVISDLQSTSFDLSRNPVYMLTLGLAVQMFRLPSDWPSGSTTTGSSKKATSMTVADYTGACSTDLATPVMSTQEKYMVSYNNMKSYQVIYDDKQTLLIKLREVKKAVADISGLPRQGWAIFDVDRDSFDWNCPNNNDKVRDRLQTVIEFLKAEGADVLPPHH
ncbi:uncharacterized protein LOC135369196 [Ornithodoros turicata]|uniref:uncharacterized protein LOC135369196 n=1 Tax=Ornithodoros turicata TaxID=34597 RepID=UPI003139E8C1